MDAPAISTDEFIETLKRSNLPTVVTEGSDDYKFYRKIEDGLAEAGISLFPVGGRSKLLDIFIRRQEIKRNNVIFLADKDLWVFTGVPLAFIHRKIIYTAGYSIENDLYCDAQIEDFLDPPEKRDFGLELMEVLQWYSFAVANLINGNPASIKDHPNRILGPNGKLDGNYMASIGFSAKDDFIFNMVQQDYQHLFRGKNLVELIMRKLSARNRVAKFGRSQIMEIGASRRGPHMQRISNEIRDIFQVL